MTDRRRNLFVLLLVAGLLLASLAVIVTKPTRLGLDLKGGVSLIYQAKPTKQSAVTGDAINRSLDIMRKRVDQLGVSEPQIQRSGADQIDVALPDVKNADQARRQIGKTAQLYFYDWETNVLDENCKSDPQNAAVTGGQSAGSGTAGLNYYDAVIRASKCDFSDTSIWSEPVRWISGSATPNLSTRSRMMSIVRCTDSLVTCDCFVGLAWKISETPPLRSRPSLVGFVAMTTADAASRPRMNSRIR